MLAPLANRLTPEQAKAIPSAKDLQQAHATARQTMNQLGAWIATLQKNSTLAANLQDALEAAALLEAILEESAALAAEAEQAIQEAADLATFHPDDAALELDRAEAIDPRLAAKEARNHV